MSFVYTTAIKKLRKMTARKRVVQGGTSAGKTFGILPILIDMAARTPRLEISVVSESIPHLRRGAMKDFIKVMQMTGRYIDGNWNRSLLTYSFVNGSYIEFFSADQEGKLRGARRNVLYINEANNIPFEAYHQLSIRTSNEIFIDFNPTAEFWAHTEVMKDDDSELIVLNYTDNEALPLTIRTDIEAARTRAETSAYWANWWRVYGLGEVGSLQGVVFNNWQQVEAMPTSFKWKAYGLDWGYTNDPTAFVEVMEFDGKLWLNEILYETGLTNADIAAKLNAYKQWETIADSAEPKSVEDLRRHGFRIRPCKKGPDSVRIGLDKMQQMPIMVTSSSTNLIKELRGYVWRTEKDGSKTNEPIDYFNHCFAGDTLIEMAKGQVAISEVQAGDMVWTSKGLRPVLKKFHNGRRNTNCYLIHTDTLSLSLHCTPDHKVKTDEGWISVSKLKPNQKLYLFKSTTGKGITSTTERTTLAKALSGCTGLFGNQSAGQFQRDTTFTTLTETLQIMTSATLRWFMVGCTYALRARKGTPTIPNGLPTSTLKEGRRQSHGTHQMRAKHGTQSTLKTWALAVLTTVSERVTIAANRMRLRMQRQSFAATLASQRGEESRALITLQERASDAEVSLSSIVSVEHNPAGLVEVFDLMIEEHHEYFANGVLVHNCIDAARYCISEKLNARSGSYTIR